ncbi:hypothetical protein Trydic_g3019 [Trypoxylus dichotomus]
MSLIENMWQIIQQKRAKRSRRLGNKAELIVAVKEEWANILQETIDDLTEKMPRRLQDLDGKKEIPTNSRVTDIQYIDIDEGLLVTWNKPKELVRCDVHYDLLYSAEFGQYTLETNTESVIIPYDTYCFNIIQVFIGAWVGNYITSYTISNYSDQRIVEEINFSVSPENQDELIVTWNKHPKQELCALEYDIEYFTNDVEKQSFNVTEPEAKFTFIYCAYAMVVIKTYGLERTHMGPIDTFNAIQYPENATRIVDIKMEPESDQTLITWTSPALIPTCNISYNISITTDRDNFTLNISEPAILVLESLYCFLIKLEIQAIIGQLVGEKITAEFEIGLDPIQNLKLTPSSPPETLTATWEDLPKQELCKIEYLVTYGYGTPDLTDYGATTQTTVDLDFAFCITTYVQVTAVSNNITSKEAVATYDGGRPVSIDAAQNIVSDEPWDDIMTVSWTPAATVYYCNVIYTVNASNSANGESANCTGTRGCDITLDNFCPSTELVVTASLLNEEPIDGVPSRETYICW